MTSIFERIVCGIDGTPAGDEALRQALRLLAPGGRLLAVACYDAANAAQAGWDASVILERLRAEAEDAREAAERELAAIPNGEARVSEGSPGWRLRTLAEDEDATLVAVGSHGAGRVAGILLGSTATALLHDGPCPVLVARPPADTAAFPSSIVVGVDGSPQSLRAVEVAQSLAERFGASVRALSSSAGEPAKVAELVSAAAGAVAVPTVEWSDQPPVDALLAASAAADLLLLGSRGLHGIAALGSVSERVAHRARCSVLVVRPPA